MPDPIDIEAHKRAIAERQRTSGRGIEDAEAARASADLRRLAVDSHPALIAEIERLREDNQVMRDAIRYSQEVLRTGHWRTRDKDALVLGRLTAALEGGR